MCFYVSHPIHSSQAHGPRPMGRWNFTVSVVPHPGPKQPAGTGLTPLYNTPRARLQAGRPAGQPVATHSRCIYQRTC